MSETTASFVCAGCGEAIDTSPVMREALLDNGCPLCATAVEETQFGEA